MFFHGSFLCERYDDMLFTSCFYSKALPYFTYQEGGTLFSGCHRSPFEVAFIPGGFMDAVAFEFGKEFFGCPMEGPCEKLLISQKFPIVDDP